MDTIHANRIGSITITDHLELNLNPDLEDVSIVDGFVNGAFCVAGVLANKPSLCIPFAKWFVDTAKEYIVYRP